MSENVILLSHRVIHKVQMEQKSMLMCLQLFLNRCTGKTGPDVISFSEKLINESEYSLVLILSCFFSRWLYARPVCNLSSYTATSPPSSSLFPVLLFFFLPFPFTISSPPTFCKVCNTFFTHTQMKFQRIRRLFLSTLNIEPPSLTTVYKGCVRTQTNV